MPLAFERGLVGVVHPDATKRSPFGSLRKPDPIEAVTAAEVLTNRFGALITMLRLGEVEGRAILTAAGLPDTVLHSIWSHRDYYVDRDGDIFVINEDHDGGAIGGRSDPARERLQEEKRVKTPMRGMRSESLHRCNVGGQR